MPLKPLKNVRLPALLVVAIVCFPMLNSTSAAVKPNLNCDGVEHWFDDRVLDPVDLMCLSQRVSPSNVAPTRNGFDASRLVGRRFSVLFEVDTFNKSTHSRWDYDAKSNTVEIRVSGDALAPDMFLTKDSADSDWWRRAGMPYGLMVRSDPLDGPDGRFLTREVYIAEVGTTEDSARLGTYPFIGRMKLAPSAAATVRRDVVFEADGVIQTANGLGPIHCGDLDKKKLHSEWLGVSVKNCVFTVRFDYLSLRMSGTGQVLSEWRRN